MAQRGAMATTTTTVCAVDASIKITRIHRRRHPSIVVPIVVIHRRPHRHPSSSIVVVHRRRRANSQPPPARWITPPSRRRRRGIIECPRILPSLCVGCMVCVCTPICIHQSYSPMCGYIHRGTHTPYTPHTQPLLARTNIPRSHPGRGTFSARYLDILSWCAHRGGKGGGYIYIV